MVAMAYHLLLNPELSRRFALCARASEGSIAEEEGHASIMRSGCWKSWKSIAWKKLQQETSLDLTDQSNWCLLSWEERTASLEIRVATRPSTKTKGD